MCGIVGLAGDLFIKHEKTFGDLLIMDQLRGFDSTGIALVGYKGTSTIIKSIDDPVTLLTSQPVKTAMVGWNKMLLGHNRAATAGTVTGENAHPFKHGTITGVHNGTLTAKYHLDNANKFAVDSEALFAHMAAKGVDDAWANMVGAASLVWWDEKDQTLNMLRNAERPMCYAYTKDKNALVWASEKFMLIAACYRQGLPILDPVTTKINTLYSFHIPNKVASTPYVITLSEREVKPTEHKPYVQYWGGVRQLEQETKKTTQETGSKISKHVMPGFIKHGSVIDVMFESVITGVPLGGNTFKGWCPQDDRVNIIATIYDGLPNATPDVIDLSLKHQIYTAKISHFVTRYVGGLPEWEVRVVSVARKQSSLVVKTDQEIDEEYILPFSSGAPTVSDCVVCPIYVNNGNRKVEATCKACVKHWDDLSGYWTKDTTCYPACDWCGSFHNSGDTIFVSNMNDINICGDCYDLVLTFMDQTPDINPINSAVRQMLH